MNATLHQWVVRFACLSTALVLGFIFKVVTDKWWFKILLVFAALSLVGHAQTPMTLNLTTHVESKPLVCGQYQHEQRTPAHCANTCSESSTICNSSCV